MEAAAPDPVSRPRPKAAPGRTRPALDESMPTDGRLARGVRTRRAVAEAMVTLLEEGDPQPTARRIAERAGVSLRAVFHHFDDMESVLRAAVVIQAERHWTAIRPVPPDVPLEERIGRFVAQRARLYDAVGPVRRAAAALEAGSPTVAAEMGRSRQMLSEDLRTTFAPELSRVVGPAGHAEVTRAALELVTSWETWDQLRRSGTDTRRARRLIEHLVAMTLGAGTRRGPEAP